MNNAQPVVIYTPSEFAFKQFTDDHPELVLYSICGFLAVFIAWAAFIQIREWWYRP